MDHTARLELRTALSAATALKPVLQAFNLEWVAELDVYIGGDLGCIPWGSRFFSQDFPRREGGNFGTPSVSFSFGGPRASGSPPAASNRSSPFGQAAPAFGAQPPGNGSHVTTFGNTFDQSTPTFGCASKSESP